jgi:hypothetical protein
MDFKTLNDVATWMISNIRLSRYDEQFVNNLTFYTVQYNRITSNQDLLFKKVVGKYKRQFLYHKIVIENLLQLSWHVHVVPSIPEYTGASIVIENNKIIFRSPYNKNFLTALRKTSLYTLTWHRDKRQHEADYSPTVLKQLMYLSADYYEVLNYCDTVTQIINSLSEYESIKYWVPTLVYKNNHYYIAALNEPLYNAIKDIELTDNLKTVATLVKYGINVDQSVTTHFLETESLEKIKFASTFEVQAEIRDVNTIMTWLKEFGCDAITEPKSFLTRNTIDIDKTLLNICKNPNELINYDNPVIVYQKGVFSLSNEKPMKLFKTIRFVNSEPIDLGPK